MLCALAESSKALLLVQSYLFIQHILILNVLRVQFASNLTRLGPPAIHLPSMQVERFLGYVKDRQA